MVREAPERRVNHGENPKTFSVAVVRVSRTIS
jgi:hypothetical protein